MRRRKEETRDQIYSLTAHRPWSPLQEFPTTAVVAYSSDHMPHLWHVLTGVSEILYNNLLHWILLIALYRIDNPERGRPKLISQIC